MPRVASTFPLHQVPFFVITSPYPVASLLQTGGRSMHHEPTAAAPTTGGKALRGAGADGGAGGHAKVRGAGRRLLGLAENVERFLFYLRFY